MQIKDILAERQKTHGDFTFNANAAQKMKQVFLSMYHDRLSYVQAESLDMIASKIARILTGNPNEPDHWRDIMGYCQLVLDSLEPTVSKMHLKIKTPDQESGEISVDVPFGPFVRKNTVPTGSGFCKCGNEFKNCPQCS